MPMPHSPLQYPTAYYTIVERVIQGETVVFNFTVLKRARYFSMRFGAFRKALQNSADQDPHMAMLAMGIQIKRDGLQVRIGPMEAEPEVVAALAQAQGAQENPNERPIESEGEIRIADTSRENR